MKKFKFYIPFIFTLCLFSASLVAQNANFKHAVTAKKLWIDHYTPFIDELAEFSEDYTDGAEIGYVRHLNDFLNLNIPFIMGAIRTPNPATRNFSQSKLYTSLGANLQIKAFRENWWLSPYLTAGGAAVKLGDEDITAEFPVGIGLNIKLATQSYVQLQSTYRFAVKDDRNNIQHGIGFQWLLGKGAAEEPKIEMPADRDGDGVTDNNDACPDEAGLVALSGCPDKDGDGVADGNDTCPETAGLAEHNGCPDTDGDGLPDIKDDCPQQAGPAENNGCPKMDNDSDGIPNDQDDCPDEAGPANLNGCPDNDGDGIVNNMDDCPNQVGSAANRGCPDRDGDGVIDKNDTCPDTAGPASNKGCPEITKEEETTLTLAQNAVEFETARATLRSSSRTVLDDIVAILKKYPNYHMRIEGHTDNIGSAESNQILSERRAKACYDYFVSKGISPTRLSHTGYGENRPIADNKYKDGRQRNRRVEFNLELK